MKPGGYSYGGGGAAAAFVVGLLCAHAVTGVGLESGERGAAAAAASTDNVAGPPTVAWSHERQQQQQQQQQQQEEQPFGAKDDLSVPEGSVAFRSTDPSAVEIRTDEARGSDRSGVDTSSRSRSSSSIAGREGVDEAVGEAAISRATEEEAVEAAVGAEAEAEAEAEEEEEEWTEERLRRLELELAAPLFAEKQWIGDLEEIVAAHQAVQAHRSLAKSRDPGDGVDACHGTGRCPGAGKGTTWLFDDDHTNHFFDYYKPVRAVCVCVCVCVCVFLFFFLPHFWF